ncbi:MAG: hypothetical protein VKP63_08325 [Cyanobacteriota bacterium]|nr:hypothetical protein [Cyanobacteriota bacterium]
MATRELPLPMRRRPTGSTRDREELRELDRALVEAVRDLHGPPTAAERLWTGRRLMALLLVLGAAARVYWLRPLDPPGVAAAVSGPGLWGGDPGALW